MNNPFDVHAWSLQYREEVWREVRACHILKHSREGGTHTSASGRVGLIFRTLFSPLLRGMRLAG
jgi:hypothetical protein